MPNSGRNATMADVAREAGVARVTVSYVLNRTAGVAIAPETRRRVIDAAERLGYRPSAAARALRRGRSDLVLGLLPDVPVGNKLGGFLQTLSAQFAGRGLTFVVHPVPSKPRAFDELWRAIDPEAIVDLGASAMLGDLEALGMPVARIHADPSQAGELAVLLPDVAYGRSQAQHLADLGHTQIGYAFPALEALGDLAKPRLHGVCTELLERALRPPDVRVVNGSIEDAERAILAWSGRAEPVTAACTYNDEVALSLLAAAHRLGRRVPQDLAIIGVDDIPAARLADPALSTVTADLTATAAHVVEMVSQQLTTPSAESAAASTSTAAADARRPEVTVEIIRRDST